MYIQSFVEADTYTPFWYGKLNFEVPLQQPMFVFIIKAQVPLLETKSSLIGVIYKTFSQEMNALHVCAIKTVKLMYTARLIQIWTTSVCV